MFELLFAWTVFTLVLGKSVEAVTHAWKGTVPPGQARRMARIREREAKAARKDLARTEGFRGWARLIWSDSWNAAAERHRERWPDKAARKAEYARARWAWWDGVQGEAEGRWEQRRRERERQRAAWAAEEAARAWEEKVRAAKEAAKARRQADDARRHADTGDPEEGGFFHRGEDGSTWYTHPGPGPYDTGGNRRPMSDAERARQAEERAERAERDLRRAAEFARRAQERADQAQREADGPTTTATPEPDPTTAPAEEEDIPDAEIVYPELEAAPAAGPDTTTEPAPKPDFTTTRNNEESNDMSNETTEAIGLDGAKAFAKGVLETTAANITTTETVVAAMENGKVGAAVVGYAQQLMDAMDMVKSAAETLDAELQKMVGVQEQYDANPDAGDKEYVATNSGR